MQYGRSAHTALGPQRMGSLHPLPRLSPLVRTSVSTTPVPAQSCPAAVAGVALCCPRLGIRSVCVHTRVPVHVRVHASVSVPALMLLRPPKAALQCIHA